MKQHDEVAKDTTANDTATPGSTAWDTVAIVGVGLIGGSIGLALRQRGLAHRVVGIGRRPASLRLARKVGSVNSTTVELARGVAKADLIIVCTPVDQIVEHVRAATAHGPPGALITDVGSTKADIVAQLDAGLPRGARFVGSHPLAGSEKAGPATANPELFTGRIVVVTPGDRTAEADVTAISRFWSSLGADVCRMRPDEHDEALAATSHLPHLAASALAAATPEEFLPLVASGWLDTTRVAAGDAELWTQIFRGNRANLLAALDRLERALADFRGALERDDRRRLGKLLDQAKRKRDWAGKRD
jgi:prephenate dehydrogenase